MVVGGRRDTLTTLPRKKFVIHSTGGRVVSRTRLDGCGKFRPAGVRSPGVQPVNESLNRLRYPVSQLLSNIFS